MRIGVISDTHNFLDAQVPKLFRGVEHILHAGDIGMPWLILELQAIAPVTAVLGNTDELAPQYSFTEVIDLAGRKFMVHHIVNPRAPDEIVRERLARHHPDVVVFGHSHKPFCEKIAGVLYFNPGYAGKSRFGMERTVAILDLGDGEMRPQYYKL